ncbi:MAG: hypothetical protein HZB72_00705 [Burkholderiales bacterium]|nr:hypothetical protein [Burkholderiales bacterium]
MGDALKGHSLSAGRFVLRGVAAAAACVALLGSPNVQALGLGRLSVQSALGESLRAEIDIGSLTPEEAADLRVKVASPETYRAAGVDYNAVLPSTVITLARRADGRPYLRLSSDRPVQEPFVDVILELSWSTGRLVREYTLLFDPPTSGSTRTAQAPAALGAPPAEAPRRPAAPEAAATPTRTAPAGSAAGIPASAPAATARAPQPAAPAARTTPTPAVREQAAAAEDEVRVRRGDTLSRIAARVQRPGVSLDQMLVGLYRANPQAFAGNNMNRLRSGAVLTVPDAQALGETSREEARQVIQAQSADFNAYRQRLASDGAAPAVDQPRRQASGQVAEVQDRKQPVGGSPDKLTLSKGGAAPGGRTAEEDRLARERAQRDAATRVAELSKNVEELKRLQGATAAASKPTASAAPAPAASRALTPVPPASAAAPAPAASPAAAALPASAAVAASAPMAASVPEAAASPAEAASMASAPEAASEAASEVASAPAPAPEPAAAPPVVPPIVADEEPGVLATLLQSPLALAGAGLAVALLAGLGFYRWRSRGKPDSGETSFLESRLQPDSFFGASGGQRIDTRDASGAPSSMSYSLSQLDAIGDVDPVAEADVYLAYGRDLQAEEILKEALRTTPDRLAIRVKLLEVYAKRRDTKGFEALATQLYALTGGQGEDWTRAQELGLTIDPENPLYAPGGQPQAPSGGPAAPLDPFDAPTLPQPAPASAFAAPAPAAGNVDLDLELDLGASSPAEPAAAPAPAATDNGLSFDLPEIPAAPPAQDEVPTTARGPLEFDLSDISLDLNAPAPAPAGAAELPALDENADFDAADPMARKIELAEEFRQIGDIEGARDLLNEVVAKASGGVKSKAQRMLDELG